MTSIGNRFGVGVSNCRPVPAVLEALQIAEQSGAEVGFVAEDIGCRDAFQLCALAAARTSTLRLATGVANPFTRNPTSLAMAAATLDEISGGRAVLGLGTSSPALIRDQMGIEPGRPLQVMDEASHIIRALWTGRPVTFQGVRFQYRDAVLDARPIQNGVPIFFAAMGPQMLHLAGRIADGVLLNVGASPQYIRWAVRQIEVGLRASGRARRQFTIAAWLAVYLDEDSQDPLQRAREWLATMLSIPRQGELLLEHGGFSTDILPAIREHVSGYPHSGDKARAASFVPPEIARQVTLVGSAEEVTIRLEDYRAAGLDLPVLPVSAIQALR